MKTSETIFKQLREYVFDLDIVDTHEHLPGFEERRNKDTDVLAEYLTHYVSSDLFSAGMTQEQLDLVRDTTQPLLKRWNIAEQHWNAASNTEYRRILDITARDIYGFDSIDRKTIVPLNEAFRATLGGGQYRRVLKDASKIRLSINDNLLAERRIDCDKEYFAPVARLDLFVMVRSLTELEELEKFSGAGIHSLDDLKNACEKCLERFIAQGAVGIKSGLAYVRPLRYDKVPAAEAERELNYIYSDKSVKHWYWKTDCAPTSALQDYMMHHVLKLANERGLTVQFHAGLQEGLGNYIYHSDPSLLANLFMEYSNIRFDILHIAYPYQQILGVLAKNFRNVFIDFAWAHMISRTAAISALVEYLDVVPANKICGFGGDFCFVDGVYGHQYLARENIARALSIKIDQGAFDVNKAEQIAKMILHDNPLAIFKLNKQTSVTGRPEQKIDKNAAKDQPAAD